LDPKSGRNFTSLSKAEKKLVVKNLYADRSEADGYYELFDEIREDSKDLPEPTCIMITGGTGVGKTTILKQYADKYPCKIVEGTYHRPVLYVSLKVCTTITTAASEILRQLETPGHDKGSRSHLMTLAQKQLELQKVELALVDECQSIVEASGEKTLYKVGDLFKDLAKRTHIPFVLSGMPSLRQVLDSNPQLKGICTPYELGPFEWNTDDKRLRFRKFLKDIGEQLPLPCHARFGDLDLAGRFFLASKGNPRIVMILIRKAALRAIARDSNRIEMTDLADIFKKFIQPKTKNLGNPFVD
jgi:hypothetical protein